MHHTEEAKKRISEKMRGEHNPNYGGKTNTPEAIQKRSQALRGKKHTEEHKRKISQSLMGHASSDKVRNALSQATRHGVIRVEDGKVFDRVKDAAAEMGCTYTAISNSIKRQQRCCGFHWRYVEPKA